ncbi:MAG: translocation/assembly module TamB domain-containing protein [Alphaproteobacteria bacterium]|nr:translocation/assembly module TamB domain-containing protein [Alphaproteobacteria bacterium]
MACTLLIGMFCFDSGRALLLHGVTKYFAMRNTVFLIKGLDSKISKADEIFIRSADGIELIFSDITFTRKQFIERSSIYVSKFVLNGSDDKIDLNTQLKGLIPLMRTLRIFISDLKLGRGYLYKIGPETYYLDNLKYVSKKNEDFLYSDINYDSANKGHSLDVVFRWDGGRSVAGDIKFKNIIGFDGTLIVKNPDAKFSDYELNATKGNCKISSNGCYKDFMLDVKIDDATINYDDKTYTCSGNVFLDNQSVKLFSEIDMEKIVNDMSYLPDDLKNAKAHFDVDCKFNGGGTVNIVLQKENERIGEISGECKNKHLNVSGDLSKIDWWGFRFSNLDVQADDFEKANISLCGEDIEISADLNFKDKIEVGSLEMVSSKGFIKSKQPFFLGKNTECAFDFNFNQLDFWNNFIPISGSGFGTLNYKNGALSGNAEFAKIDFGSGYKLFAAKVSGDAKNFVCDAETVAVSGLLLHRFNMKKRDDNFELTSAVNNVGTLKATGNLSENFKQVSIKKCEVFTTNSVLKTNSCNFDFEKGCYDLECALFSKKLKACGTAKVSRTPSEWIFNFKEFQAFRLAELLQHSALKFVIDGGIKLTAVNNYFVGDGKFSLRGVMAHANVLNAETHASTNGIKIKVDLTKDKSKLAGEASLPILILKDGDIIQTINDGMVSCRFFGRSNLEHVFELTDDSDLKGELNCDFSINGNLANPNIKGFLNLKDAYISIGDLVLKNGNVSLIGSGKNIIVERASFRDDDSRTATVSGKGELFFEGWRPDIDTKLNLFFDKFTLFDSEEMKIVVDGTGAISGPIKDMKLKGNINVPKCEIRNFKTDNSSENEIEVENVAHKPRKQAGESSEDFFDYDISMHCPDISFSGSIFNVALSGDLKLVSYSGKASLEGKLNLSDGKLDLFGKRMKFTEGRIVFLEEFPFDPKAYLVCRGNFSDIVVQLVIRNSPSKGVVLKLSSTPNYSIEVILSMMMFGKEMKYLSVGEAAQLAHIVSRINERGNILSILNTFQDIGIVDSLSFSSDNNGSSTLYSNTQSSSSQNNVNVSAGKYIHDNVYVSVNKREKETTFDVDLSVTPTVSVKANTAGEVGVSWKYRY